MGFAFAPVGRLDLKPALGIGVDPAPLRQAAGEHQGIGAKLVGDLQLDFPVGRRGINRLPETIVLFRAIEGQAAPQSSYPSDSNAGRRRMFPAF